MTETHVKVQEHQEPAIAMAPHNFYGGRGRRRRQTRKDEHVGEEEKIQEEHVGEEAKGTSGCQGQEKKEE